MTNLFVDKECKGCMRRSKVDEFWLLDLLILKGVYSMEGESILSVCLLRKNKKENNLGEYISPCEA